jgi:hypothetical protein
VRNSSSRKRRIRSSERCASREPQIVSQLRDVDLSEERWAGVLEPLNDRAFFAQVTVDTESGTVTWPGGIDLAPEPLYEQARAHPLVAA